MYKRTSNRSIRNDKGKPKTDLTGMTFGYLTVLRLITYPEGQERTTKYNEWVCTCSLCGEETVKQSFHLTNGSTKSCGCLSSVLTTHRNTKHGLRKSSEWSIWNGIKKRCNNSKCRNYAIYGGRGIKICESWNNSENGFITFYNDMGKRPSLDHSIDRIDPNGDYCPENCRWETRKVQSRNKRTNVWFEYDGERMVQSDWCKLFKISTVSFLEYYNKYGFEAAYKFYMNKLKKKDASHMMFCNPCIVSSICPK